MTESQLRILVAVIDARGFSAAAVRLQTSQPAVSRAVAGLEEELGVQLLTRAPGAVAPTNVGVRVAAHARAVLARTEAMRQAAGAVSGRYAGRLRVGSLPGLSARFVAPVLARFCAEHRGARVDLWEAPDDVVLDALRSYAVDVGLVVRRADDMDVARLGRIELVAVLPPAHRLADAPAIRLADLQAEPLILALTGFEHLLADAFRGEGRDLLAAFRVRDAAAALALVADDVGVSVLPDVLAEGATTRPLQPPLRLRLGLAARRRAEATPLAHAFLETAISAPNGTAEHQAHHPGLAP